VGRRTKSAEWRGRSRIDVVVVAAGRSEREGGSRRRTCGGRQWMGDLGAAENRKEQGGILGTAENGKEHGAGSCLACAGLGVAHYATTRRVAAYPPPLYRYLSNKSIEK
jgi:hypothetical protein